MSQYMTNVMLKHLEWLWFQVTASVEPNGVVMVAKGGDGQTYVVRSDGHDTYAVACQLAQDVGVELEDG